MAAMKGSSCSRCRLSAQSRISISDVVVVGDDAYYVDKSGFKPLHEFMTGGRNMQRSEVAEQHKPDERREEPQQDKPDAPEKTAEHRKKKSR